MAIVEVVAKQRLGDEEVRNVFHIETVFGSANPEQAAGDALRTYWANMTDYLHPTWTLYGYSYRNAQIVGSQAIDVDYAAPLAGIEPFDRLPGVLAGLVNFKTQTTPPNSGRKYIAGLTEGSNTSAGVPDNPTILELQTWGNRFTAHNAGGEIQFRWVIARKDPETGLVTAANEIRTATARRFWGTMRSRRTSQ